MKDSGAAWLGDIPAGWGVSKIFAHYKRKRDKNHPTEELLSVYRDYGVIPKSSRDDNFNTESTDLSNYQLVEPNDLVTNKMKTWQGSIAISKYRGIVSPAYYVMSPTKTGGILPQFTHYLLRSPVYISQYKRLSKGVRPGQWDLEYEQFKGLEIPLPDYRTQERIATYIDRETLKVDELIAKQHRLLELLAEKHRSAITEVVTHGLNPTTNFRDAGPWFGEIPSHWRLGRLKSEMEIVGGGTPSKDNLEYWSGEIPWASPKDIKSKILSQTKDHISQDALNDSTSRLVPKGSMLIVFRSGILRHSIPTTIIGVDMAINQDLKALIPKGELSPQFLAYLIEGYQGPLLVAWSKQGATVESLEYGLVANTTIPIPPKPEQEQIVSYLDDLQAKFNELTSTINKQILLLKERRTSLISHAVTGKIKV